MVSIVSILDTTQLEGKQGVSNPIRFTVKLSEASSADISVTVALQRDGLVKHTNAVQGVDWTSGDPLFPLTATVTIPAGQLEGSFVLKTIGDDQIEPNEILTATIVNLSGDPTALIGAQRTGKATILNDDGAQSDHVIITGLSVLPEGLRTLLTQDIEAAVARIEQALGTFATLEIGIVLKVLDTAAAAEPVYSHAFVSIGPDPQIPNALYKYHYPELGDPGPQSPDMLIYVDPSFLDRLYAGKRSTKIGDVLSGADVTTMLTHEILHGLGFGDMTYRGDVLPLGRSIWSDLIEADGTINGHRLAPNKHHLASSDDPSAPSDLMEPFGWATPNNPISADVSALMKLIGYDGALSESFDLNVGRVVDGIGLGSQPYRKAVHGYLQGAIAFADANGNGIADVGEVTAQTDAGGGFEILDEQSVMLVSGGTDSATRLPFKGQLMAPAGSNVITPLTTLVVILQSSGVINAEQAVLDAMDLPPDLPLFDFDPIAATLLGSVAGASAEVAAAKVYTAAMLIGSALSVDGGDLSARLKTAMSTIAAAVVEPSFSLTEIDSVKALLSAAAFQNNIELSATMIEVVAAVVVESTSRLQAALLQEPGKEVLDTIAAIELVAHGAASPAIQQSGGNASSLSEILAAFTGANLDEQIAEAAAELSGQEQNHAPVASNLSAATSEDASIEGSLPATDADGDALMFAIASAPIHGTVALDGDTYTYTPFANFNGTDSFTFKVNDGRVDSTPAVVSITIAPAHDAAIIDGARSGLVAEDGQLTAFGQLTVVDPDADEASFQPGTIAGVYGALTLAATGAWTYALDNAKSAVQALNSGQSLTDKLTVRSADGTASEISISINGADETTAGVIDGTNRGEVIKGTLSPDIIVPLRGGDIVNARDGDDIIKASVDDGNDFYYGDGGSDTVDYSALSKAVDVDLGQLFCIGTGSARGKQSGTDLVVSIENVIGSQAGDEIDGNSLANRLAGGGGSDTIKGHGGNDTLLGGDGKDTLYGGSGNDQLNGGSGADILIAGGGKDRLEGGAGNDRLTGDAGVDTFVFKPGFGNDRITDFDANPANGQDFIELSGLGITAADFAARVRITDIGADTLVAIDGDPNQTIRLVGVGNANTITVDDFKFL